MRTILIIIFNGLFTGNVMGQISFSPVECTLKNNNNELIFSSSTTICKFPLKRQLTVSPKNNFATVDKQTMQIMFLKFDGYHQNTKGENLDNQKQLLDSYSKYELEYFRNHLNIEIINPNSQWISTKSRGWFIWYFKVGSITKQVNAKAENQLFATTVIEDKIFIINAPILKGDDFSRSALFVNEMMEAMAITKNK